MKPKTRVRELSNGKWVAEHRSFFIWYQINHDGYGNANPDAWFYRPHGYWHDNERKATKTMYLFLAMQGY